MKAEELDVAGSEVYEIVKMFLCYCPNASEDSAVKAAIESVEMKYTNINRHERAKLINLAKKSYDDLIRKVDFVEPKIFGRK